MIWSRISDAVESCKESDLTAKDNTEKEKGRIMNDLLFLSTTDALLSSQNFERQIRIGYASH